MSIIYCPECDKNFKDYGIEIPLFHDRSSAVFNFMAALDKNLSPIPADHVPAISREDLLLAHNADFIDRLYGSYAELERELMVCYELVDEYGLYHRYNPKNARYKLGTLFGKILQQVGLTYFSTKAALKNGFSFYLGGGMHHAMSFGGRGFCLVNDIVITLRKLQNEERIKSAWVIDVDAHKGDGTAEITKRDQSIATLSIHMQEGWPLDSGTVRDPWFIPSNVDIGIAINEESQYLDKLQEGLLTLERDYPSPDVVIVVNGADPFEFDELESTSKLKLTKEQLFLRDKMVYEFLKSRHIPQSYVMAGGYGARSWEIYAQFLRFVWESSSEGTVIGPR